MKLNSFSNIQEFNTTVFTMLFWGAFLQFRVNAHYATAPPPLDDKFQKFTSRCYLPLNQGIKFSAFLPFFTSLVTSYGVIILERVVSNHRLFVKPQKGLKQQKCLRLPESLLLLQTACSYADCSLRPRQQEVSICVSLSNQQTRDWSYHQSSIRETYIYFTISMPCDSREI